MSKQMEFQCLTYDLALGYVVLPYQEKAARCEAFVTAFQRCYRRRPSMVYADSTLRAACL